MKWSVNIFRVSLAVLYTQEENKQNTKQNGENV